ncbi:MAG: UDP-N-acetylmuramoyl-tripeptide--D-alanyl-D-alanine ligase, partial [Clostridia bacterium]|nr:UDP-N-acetylmuramoyl-tripeptide--D-alanyl-D-alanine ligase [Clostridia bacterium]
LLGRHNVYNCLASMGIALDLGLTIHEIQEGLDGVKLTGMRLERTAGIRGATIINDTYNANPSSMLASLEVLKEFRNMRTIAVLGDMLELGNIAPQKHREIGEAVVRLGINLLVTVGKLGEYIAEAAIAEGMSPDNMFITYDNKEAISYLRDILGPGDVLLIKGSRMLGMEDMVRNLEEPGS